MIEWRFLLDLVANARVRPFCAIRVFSISTAAIGVQQSSAHTFAPLVGRPNATSACPGARRLSLEFRCCLDSRCLPGSPLGNAAAKVTTEPAREGAQGGEAEQRRNFREWPLAILDMQRH